MSRTATTINVRPAGRDDHRPVVDTPAAAYGDSPPNRRPKSPPERSVSAVLPDCERALVPAFRPPASGAGWTVDVDKPRGDVMSEARTLLVVHRQDAEGFCMGCLVVGRLAWSPCLQAEWAHDVLRAAEISGSGAS